MIAAVEDLPEEIRTALTLREIDGLSYEEIAQIMNCPIGTVRSRIFRGRDAVDRADPPAGGGLRNERRHSRTTVGVDGRRTRP